MKIGISFWKKLKSNEDFYVLIKLIKKGKIDISILNKILDNKNIPDLYKNILNLLTKEDVDNQKVIFDNLIEKIHEDSDFEIRVLARSLRIADMESSEEL